MEQKFSPRVKVLFFNDNKDYQIEGETSLLAGSKWYLSLEEHEALLAVERVKAARLIETLEFYRANTHTIKVPDEGWYFHEEGARASKAIDEYNASS